MNKIKVLKIVKNSVSRDARVLREARALAKKEEYLVTILGIVDKHYGEQYEKLQDNLQIVRIQRPNLKRGWLLFLYSFIQILLWLPICLAIYNHNTVVSIFNEVLSMNLSVMVYKYTVALKQIWVETLMVTIYIMVFIIFTFKYIRFLLAPWKVSKKNIMLLFKQKIISNCMYKAMKKQRYDIVHCHDFSTLDLGYKYKKQFGCKLVFDSHEIYEETTGWSNNRFLKRIFHFYMKKYAPMVDLFVTVNNSIGQYITALYPSLPSAVIVKNACEFKEVTSEQSDIIYESLNIPKNKKILIYHGGLSNGRNLELLIETACYLHEEWVVVFLGWGVGEHELKRLVDEKNLHHKIFFHPPVPQSYLIEYVFGATVGIIPYGNTCLNHWYCTPNKLWEYTMAGIPMLVNDFPELSKMILKYDIGWVIKNELSKNNLFASAYGLAQQINSLSEDDIKQKKANCLKTRNTENWDKYSVRLIKAYSSLIIV